MRAAILSACLSAAAAVPASGQAIVVMENAAYDCQYVLDNMESDRELRSFMIDYTFGFLSGVNVQRRLNNQTVIDFGPIDNPMLITWTYQVCSQNAGFSYAQALVRLFEVLLAQQNPQGRDKKAE